MKTIVWFRQDLRVQDNPALLAAAQRGEVLPVFILDDEEAGSRKRGAASRVWLHHALEDLNSALEGQLHLAVGRAEDVLSELVEEFGITAVFWNRCYEPWRIVRDRQLKSMLTARGIEAQSFNGSLLWEPWTVLKKDLTPYKVFTPFYRKGCLGSDQPRKPLSAPAELRLIKAMGTKLETLNLKPDHAWPSDMINGWDASESGAVIRVSAFLNEGLSGYGAGRDHPADPHVSRLSPYLHFGQISPHQIWHQLASLPSSDDLDKFRSEIAWREFAYYLLFHFPEVEDSPLQKKFAAFPWRKDEDNLKAWQKGMTGYPIIDAGMRQLWQTGYVHNRVRMIVASFLTKNLMIDWREGERWFWDCLVDADGASNPVSWQWVAGSGADAAPYFRIFNPVTQSRKFDAKGTYIRTFVPELVALPDKHIHAPFEAPASVLEEAGIELDETYPLPIVDLKASRERALTAFKGI